MRMKSIRFELFLALAYLFVRSRAQTDWKYTAHVYSEAGVE